jgi:hypothetical protein
MRIITFIAVIALATVFVSSCEKKIFKAPVVDPNAPVSFTTEIQPLFTAKCAASGCHSGAISPNLTEGKAYSSLIDGGLVDTLNAATSVLYVKLTTNMPPTKLPASDINKVLYWIKQGAREK